MNQKISPVPAAFTVIILGGCAIAGIGFGLFYGAAPSQGALFGALAGIPISWVALRRIKKTFPDAFSEDAFEQEDVFADIVDEWHEDDEDALLASLPALETDFEVAGVDGEAQTDGRPNEW